MDLVTEEVFSHAGQIVLDAISGLVAHGEGTRVTAVLKTGPDEQLLAWIISLQLRGVFDPWIAKTPGYKKLIVRTKSGYFAEAE